MVINGPTSQIYQFNTYQWSLESPQAKVGRKLLRMDMIYRTWPISKGRKSYWGFFWIKLVKAFDLQTYCRPHNQVKDANELDGTNNHYISIHVYRYI